MMLSGCHPASKLPSQAPARPRCVVPTAAPPPLKKQSHVQPAHGSRRPARAVAAAAAGAAGGQAGPAPPVVLTLPDSTKVAMPQAVLVVGSGADADLQLQGTGVAAAHARLEFKSGRLFCTALTGDPDLLLAPTQCWLDGVELRPGVSYMVAPGSALSLGTQDTRLTCNFSEGGSSAMTEMLMKGLAASASKEVQEKLGGL